MLVCTDVFVFPHPALLVLKGLLASAGSAQTDFAAALTAKFMEKSEKQILAKCKKNR